MLDARLAAGAASSRSAATRRADVSRTCGGRCPEITTGRFAAVPPVTTSLLALEPGASRMSGEVVARSLSRLLPFGGLDRNRFVNDFDLISSDTQRLRLRPWATSR